MADFKRSELEIGLDFGHLSFDKHKNFSKGSCEPKKYTPSNSSAGAAAPQVFNSNYWGFLVVFFCVCVFDLPTEEYKPLHHLCPTDLKPDLVI